MTARLPDDCFATPQGAPAWTPVDVALERLRAALAPIAGVEIVALGQADGRVLAQDVLARRPHPACDNSAVDGYAFRHPGAAGPLSLALVAGRSAAGAPWGGPLRESRLGEGEAVRIFTGAPMPPGADTVVMQEDCALGDGRVTFTPPAKPGANRRRSGENLRVGAVALPEGLRLTPQALAQAASAGHASLPVRVRLRVALASTGDELIGAGSVVGQPPHRVADANRPMLAALLARLGAEVVDLGMLRDDPAKLAAALDRGAAEADAIVLSGGASGGEEDHASRLIAAGAAPGAFHLWRVAMKPGRPLSMGVWRGAPVFGLPGNPVAAFVCALLFVRPALARLGGAPWPEPRPVPLPAGFTQPKKPGRREYLRVRRGADGRLERYRSDGSGLIEGLIWAEGLADLAHDAGPVAEGDAVAFLSWAELGL